MEEDAYSLPALLEGPGIGEVFYGAIAQGGKILVTAEFLEWCEVNAGSSEHRKHAQALLHCPHPTVLCDVGDEDSIVVHFNTSDGAWRMHVLPAAEWHAWMPAVRTRAEAYGARVDILGESLRFLHPSETSFLMAHAGSGEADPEAHAIRRALYELTGAQVDLARETARVEIMERLDDEAW